MKKRVLALVFAVFMALSLAACGTEKQAGANGSNQSIQNSVLSEDVGSEILVSENEFSDSVINALQSVSATESTISEFNEFKSDGKMYYLADLYSKMENEEDLLVGKIVVDSESVSVQTALPLFAQEYIEPICKSSGLQDPSIRYVNEMASTIEEATYKSFDANGYRISVSLVEGGIDYEDITESFRFMIVGGDDIENYEEGKTETITLK